MIIKRSCKVCGKTTDLTSEINLGKTGKHLIFKCGHSYIEPRLAEEIKVKESSSSSPAPDSEQVEETIFQKLAKEIPSWCEEHQRNCIKSLSSHTGKHLFPYQRDGIIAATNNNARFIFADEMGLGKTVQGLGTILINKHKLLPCLFFCKSIAKVNMLWEVMDWLNIPAQVMTSSSETPHDMFQVHILSYDMMNRLDKLFGLSDIKPEAECPECNFRGEADKFLGKNCPCCSEIKQGQADGDRKVVTEERDGKIVTTTRIETTVVSERKAQIPTMIEFVDKTLFNTSKNLRDQNKIAWIGILKRTKTVILDEVHLLKNPSSQRSKAVKAICSNIPHVLPMSGTLIKNSATEYFIPLNIVRPERYWRYQSFCMNYVRLDYVRSVTGAYVKKYTGLTDPDEFMKTNKDFMIRRTVDEVLPELPKLWKQQKFVELEKAFKDIYDKSEEAFVDWYEQASQAEIRANLLAQLALLRHQTSLAKIDFTIDLALEFITSNEKRKLAIFTHHIDSREILADKMISFFKETLQNDRIVCTLTQGGKDVQDEIEKFKNDNGARILILSTLSHGESINLQFMRDSILHERQWNPANENQAISGRFRRIGQEGDKIICQIPVALGTVDEYMVNLNVRKDSVASEIDTGVIGDYEGGFALELADMIASKGRNKWKL